MTKTQKLIARLDAIASELAALRQEIAAKPARRTAKTAAARRAKTPAKKAAKRKARAPKAPRGVILAGKHKAKHANGATHA